MDLKSNFDETGVLDYNLMVKELCKRTHLSESICKKVYDAEADILMELGIMEEPE